MSKQSDKNAKAQAKALEEWEADKAKARREIEKNAVRSK